MSNESVEKFGYKQELHRALTYRDLLVYGLIFMVPIAPFGIFGGVFQGSGGMIALAYAIGMVGMMITASSYAQMSKAFPMAGSVYKTLQFYHQETGIHTHNLEMFAATNLSQIA